ncbi:MAG: hypothetical protein E7Z67_02910 [Thermoplasmata archaeon]|nr:hypothetical protein [Thermoplasmata archaeon]
MNVHERMTKLTAFAVTLLLLSSVLVVFNADSDASSSEYYVLLDKGNGETEWAKQSSGATVQDVLIDTLESMGADMTVVGSAISVDGVDETTIGVPGTGTYGVSGSTGVTVTSFWNVYKWDGNAWISASLSDSATNVHLSLAFGPSGYIPAETPEYRNSWVMIRGDARQTGNLDSDESTVDESAVTKWTDSGSHYASALHVGKYVISKFGIGGGMGGTAGNDVRIVCYDYETGDKEWTFSYPGIENYETGTPLIVSNEIFIPSGFGYVIKFDWMIGPGELQDDGTWTNDVRMTTSDGSSAEYDEDEFTQGGCAPMNIVSLEGTTYQTGNTSLVYDSGAIFFSNSNGMTYCIDRDLNLLWSYQSGGSIYFTTPTIVDDYVFFGALNGHLYILDKISGVLIDEKKIYTNDFLGQEYGGVASPAVFKIDGTYKLILPVSEGRGMSTRTGGYATATFDGSNISNIVKQIDVIGMTGNFLTMYESDNFNGVFASTSQGLYKISVDGSYTFLSDDIKTTKGPLNLVNDSYLIVASYAPIQVVYKIDLNGKIISTASGPTSLVNFCMTSVLVIGDWLVLPNDSGLAMLYGAFTPYVYDEPEPESNMGSILLVAGIILLALAGYYCFMRFGKKVDRPFGIIVDKLRGYLGADPMTHNTRSRHRLLVVLMVGSILTIVMFIICLCIGPTSVMSPAEAVKSLFSAVSKGGENLTYNELMVYSSRLPRTIVALVVGIGLSMAGVMYQALIRNPLVDPYIMGVSSGAGTAAIAVIGFNFTFFGLFPAHSLYLTAFAAMVGGIVAFVITMLLAEKAGGSSVNYVLAGVVVGLVFSAAQSIMLTTATEQVSSSLSWLYGSFSSVSWEHVAIVTFPVLAMSLAPLIWAKEFNLVLLGEDQAKQMGLNVKWFNRLMLILASVLTSLCVAFVGIIGFVGLVIPHLCRMILGGDHRLVMPASIALGGFLMMFADLASRTLWSGIELPVGAITTLIGIPVFAWLLIKRGKMYDG